MKKKQLSLLLTAALIALSAGACGTENPAPSGQETPDTAPAGDETAADTQETGENTENPEETDTNVTSSDTEESGEAMDAVSPASVTFEETNDEIKADDGTVLLENSVSMPVVAIEGAEEIAAKINADIEEYYTRFSSDNDDIVEMLKSHYEASQTDEDGGWFNGGTQSVFADVTRMDDKVLSLELTSYAYTGGAHGNSGAVGKNYDLNTGEPLAFEDLSEDISAFHAAALDYMVNLAESPEYKDRLFGPTKADLDSTLFQSDNWVFTSDGIRFFSDPYALGPYASGEIYFRLPYEKAYEVGLKEDYRYSGSFTQEHYYITKYDHETFEPIVDGTPSYSFDLNGDGTEEGLAFYGLIQSAEDGSSQYAYFIDGADWGEVVNEQIGDAAKNGYLDTSYALYDADPSDGLTEIAVLFTEFYDDGSESGLSGTKEYSYLFQYTADKKLQFMERRDGFVTKPDMPQ